MDCLNILILDDERYGVKHLHDALSVSHNLTWTRTIQDALSELEKSSSSVDVIICGTHLLSESMFDFLKQVKSRADSKSVPFICFRAASTEFAEKVDVTIEQTAKILGATKYISVPAEENSIKLREAVEAEIRPLVLRSR